MHIKISLHDSEVIKSTLFQIPFNVILAPQQKHLYTVCAPQHYTVAGLLYTVCAHNTVTVS